MQELWTHYLNTTNRSTLYKKNKIKWCSKYKQETKHFNRNYIKWLLALRTNHHPFKEYLVNFLKKQNLNPYCTMCHQLDTPTHHIYCSNLNITNKRSEWIIKTLRIYRHIHQEQYHRQKMRFPDVNTRTWLEEWMDYAYTINFPTDLSKFVFPDTTDEPLYMEIIKTTIDFYQFIYTSCKIPYFWWSDPCPTNIFLLYIPYIYRCILIEHNPMDFILLFFLLMNTINW